MINMRSNSEPITKRISKSRNNNFPVNQEVTMNADGSGGPISIAKKIGPQGLGVLGNNGYHIGSPSKQTKRYDKVMSKSKKTAAKGRKAVDEGRDAKAGRLLKKAARQENRAIKIEEKTKSPAKKKDACYSKVKARYDVWPSAYASGALSKCRKVGAANWGNKSKKKK